MRKAILFGTGEYANSKIEGIREQYEIVCCLCRKFGRGRFYI